ncbi:MAG: ferrous iron transport protein A [Planctomycetia bacterium]|nr:ferrous iron transport protein A [Planctomycetia bacterium]
MTGPSADAKSGAPAPAPDPAARTLADLAVGEKARVARLEGAGVAVQRLAEMGLTPGAMVTVVRFAPLGDPVEVKVRGYALSLRKVDARCVRVADPEAPGAGGRAP